MLTCVASCGTDQHGEQAQDVKRGGQLQLGAVEYIVPAAEWDGAGNTDPPSLLGHHLHLNQELGIYVLHIWLWQDNPSGMFEDWNPNVSCPSK